MPSYHDTHFHLDLFENPHEIVEEIEFLKIYTIAVTNVPSVFHFTEKIAVGRKYLRAALGFHPELIHQRPGELDLFLKSLALTKYIGEIGLDNMNKTPQDYSVQKKVFSRIIEACSEQGGKVLTVHSRRATSDVIDTIGSQFSGKVILHWYSGSMKDLTRALNNGYYFSVNYPMTISESGRKIIKAIPVERMLLETDGPFTKYQHKPCTPTVSKFIVQEIGKNLDNIEPTGLLEQISQNFKHVLT